MKRRFLISLTLTTLSTFLLTANHAGAAGIPSEDFSLEVSPSPLIAEVQPGKTKTLELKIRNASKKPENLKIQVRGFSIARPSEEISITNTTPPDLAQWVSFSHPIFTVPPGQWFSQKITINLPESAGFSYPFVVVISREDDPAAVDGGAAVKGSIAVFTLVNINKPGATRKLEIESFKLDRNFYEYLPAVFNIKLKNTGNSIVQPYGNLYIQNPGKESSPLAVLPVNQTGSYILPGSSKEINSTWADGFPVFKTATDKNGKMDKSLQWDLDNIAHFRFGRYTAKLVAVYNDGTRDIPLVSEVSFWVIPWRILLGALVIVAILVFGIWSIVKRVTHHTKRIIRRTPRG